MDKGKLEACIISEIKMLYQSEKCKTIHSCFLRSLSFSRCWCNNSSAPHCKLKVSGTIQGAWPPTDPYDIQQTTKKLFQQHLVSHAFLSITFAFCGCLRLVEAFNCHSDWRQTRRNLEIPFEFLTKTENQMLHHIISTNRNEQSDLIRSSQVWSDPYFVDATLSCHLRSY